MAQCLELNALGSEFNNIADRVSGRKQEDIPEAIEEGARF